MDDDIFLRRLSQWKMMPDHITDVQDFQLTKTRPYPGELKGEAFQALYAEATDEQRRSLPYLFSPTDPSATFAIDKLCQLFLDSDPSKQEKLRNSPLAKAVSAPDIDSWASGIISKNDVILLRKGLAATILLNGRDDYRDELMALARLWLAAARANIDPLPYFQAAAEIASTDDPHGIGSTRDTLANFHKYAIFREQVEPYLPGKVDREE